jgi:hypothetical protein
VKLDHTSSPANSYWRNIIRSHRLYLKSGMHGTQAGMQRSGSIQRSGDMSRRMRQASQKYVVVKLN